MVRLRQKNHSLPDTQQILNGERQTGNYRFLSSFELFFHIYRFDEQEITNGNILSLTKQELADGYNLDHNELRYFNVLIKILNNLFYFSRNGAIKNLEIISLPENMLLVGKIATGSIESDLFANLVAIVN